MLCEQFGARLFSFWLRWPSLFLLTWVLAVELCLSYALTFSVKVCLSYALTFSVAVCLSYALTFSVEVCLSYALTFHVFFICWSAWLLWLGVREQCLFPSVFWFSCLRCPGRAAGYQLGPDHTWISQGCRKGGDGTPGRDWSKQRWSAHNSCAWRGSDLQQPGRRSRCSVSNLPAKG